MGEVGEVESRREENGKYKGERLEMQVSGMREKLRLVPERQMGLIESLGNNAVEKE